MLDTHGRDYVQPFIDKGAKEFIKRGYSANKVTIIALCVGVLAPISILLGFNYVAFILLWISGYLDAVDGTVARMTKNTSSWGTVMDICFDRLIEQLVIIALAIKYPHARIYLLILASTCVLSITVFLVVGIMSKKESKKSFYYQAGLTERTETFIFFSLMLLSETRLVMWIVIFTFAIWFTFAQRLFEAKKYLN